MNIEDIKNKVPENIRNLLTPKNIAILLSGLLLISLLGVIAVKVLNREEYAVLYTHLNPDDAGSILGVLQEEHIPYRIEGNGTIILVPKDKVYEVRLKLASKGLPSSKTVGFEIFEEPKMGITHFQENINYLRALEGELARTIRDIDAIQNARVNIALPKESIFVRETDEPKASVVVKLWPGRDLTPEQIKAIVFLVSHAVPRLKPENVTVIDNKGRVLSDILEDKEKIASGKSLEIKRKLEKQIEKNVYAILSKAVGPDKVAVKASVEIEIGKFRQKEEIYDPDRTAVVSERKIQENEQGVRTPQSGAPGTATNVPPVIQGTQTSERTQRQKKDITKNYDVTRTLVDTEKPIFRIKRVSVGVLLDGKYVEEKTKDGKTVKKFIPLSKEEIEKYKALVESVIGYNPKRGDKVTVVSIPFSKAAAAGLMPYKEKEKTNLILLGGIALLVLILIGAVLFILKKKKEKVTVPTGVPGVSPEAAAGLYAAHEKEVEELKIEREPIYKKILEVSEESPELIAKLLSKWLKEEK